MGFLKLDKARRGFFHLWQYTILPFQGHLLTSFLYQKLLLFLPDDEDASFAILLS
jgi:hypothetical protein